MVKLSRAGWNNVIIFGVLAFILIINATHDNVFENKTDQQQVRLFPANPVILTLSINEHFLVERKGQGWQANRDTLSVQALNQMMNSWRQLAPEHLITPVELDKQLGLLVEVVLANNNEAMRLKLFMEDEQLLVYREHDRTWFVLAPQFFNQLVPAEIFNE